LSGIEILLKTDAVPPLPSETQLVFFRTVQELPNDVHLHCGASQPSITMEWQEAKVRVTISDNGNGVVRLACSERALLSKSNYRMAPKLSPFSNQKASSESDCTHQAR
jgi:signal transduction histidine kinase